MKNCLLAATLLIIAASTASTASTAVIASIASTATGPSAGGQTEVPGTMPTQDARAAAEDVAAQFSGDWNSHDMKSFGALFTADADFVNVIGLWWHGRREIQQAHEMLHATRMKNSRLTAIETVTRRMGPDVAIVHVRWELTGDTGLDGILLPPRRGILALVVVDSGGKWSIASGQNTDIVPLPNLPPPK